MASINPSGVSETIAAAKLAAASAIIPSVILTDAETAVDNISTEDAVAGASASGVDAGILESLAGGQDSVLKEMEEAAALPPPEPVVEAVAV